MNDLEIKAKIKKQIKTGQRISFRYSLSPDKPGQAAAGMCSNPIHKCVACGDERPMFEFGSGDAKICLHERCFQLWKEVEADSN